MAGTCLLHTGGLSRLPGLRLELRLSLSHEAGHDAAVVQAVKVALRRFQHLSGHSSRCLWMAPVPAMAVSSLWTQTFTSSLGDLLTASREGWCVCLHVCSRDIFFFPTKYPCSKSAIDFFLLKVVRARPAGPKASEDQSGDP